MANTPKAVRKVAGQVVKDYKKVSDKKLPPLQLTQKNGKNQLSVTPKNDAQAKVLKTDIKGYAVKQVRKAANKVTAKMSGNGPKSGFLAKAKKR
jgi:hypothetical protein